MSKEEHYEERKRLYNLFKTDCPQTIGETDKAFDNDNFIDWLVDNQNTKPLIEKISSLEASLLDVTRKSCARVDELTDEIAKLKASKSEANEADLDLIWTDVCISIVNRENNRVPFVDTLKYLKSKFTITRNNK